MPVVEKTNITFNADGQADGLKVPPQDAFYFAGRRLAVYRIREQINTLIYKPIPADSLVVIDLDMLPRSRFVYTLCWFESHPGTFLEKLWGVNRNTGEILVDNPFGNGFARALKFTGVPIACFNKDGSLLWRGLTKEEKEKSVGGPGLFHVK